MHSIIIAYFLCGIEFALGDIYEARNFNAPGWVGNRRDFVFYRNLILQIIFWGLLHTGLYIRIGNRPHKLDHFILCVIGAGLYVFLNGFIVAGCFWIAWHFTNTWFVAFLLSIVELIFIRFFIFGVVPPYHIKWFEKTIEGIY
jgi:hypothetical protein